VRVKRWSLRNSTRRDSIREIECKLVDPAGCHLDVEGGGLHIGVAGWIPRLP